MDAPDGEHEKPRKRTRSGVRRNTHFTGRAARMNNAMSLLLASLLLSGCAGERVPEPSVECAAAWNEGPARELTDLLLQATSAHRTIWTDYDTGDAAYVIYTVAPDSAGVCLGLWREGRAVGFAHTDDFPVLLTPLYGYYFASDWHGGPDVPMLEHAMQPASIRAWLESEGVESAVVLPVTAPDFPMQLPPLVKVQLGMHEAFHVNVQAPRWYASTGNWPSWDRQPDRPGVQACYTANDEAIAASAAEREQLATLIENLLDGDTAAACEKCRAFLAQRMARYALLEDIHVMRSDSTQGSCAEAEAIMELEEGTADYASWTLLHDLGLASRESLLRRYRAIQNDAFYLTGAMQLHAVALMQPDSMPDVMRRIAASSGWEEGSPTAVLTRALASFCPVESDPVR
jgi:hypothetical protein